MRRMRHRTRNSSFPILGGRDRESFVVNSSAPDERIYTHQDSYRYDRTLVKSDEGVIDTTGSKGAVDNPFHLDRTVQRMPYVHFAFKGSAVVSVWGEWYYTQFINDSAWSMTPPSFGNDGGMLYSPHHLELPEISESQNDYVVKMAARLNPSRPSVELGVTLAELVGLPLALSKMGSKLAKAQAKDPTRSVNWAAISPENPGSAYLALRYGWEPLIKEIRKMMRLVDGIEKKLDKYRRLQEKGLLRASSKKFPETYVHNAKHSFRDAYGTLWEASTTRVVKRWCTLYYKPDTGTLMNTDRSSLLAARRAAYGLNIDGSTMWQIMPWSWLVDWFGNYGDYIDSHRNTIGAKLDKCLVMETESTETVVVPVIAAKIEDIIAQEYNLAVDDPISMSVTLSAEESSVRMTQGSFRSVRKTRTSVMPQAETNLSLQPILGSGYRSSILAALAVQRGIRG